MTEFALILPLLVVLLFGIIQFGIIFNNYVTLTDARAPRAREGAVSRQSVDPPGRLCHAGATLPGGTSNPADFVYVLRPWAHGVRRDGFGLLSLQRQPLGVGCGERTAQLHHEGASRMSSGPQGRTRPSGRPHGSRAGRAPRYVRDGARRRLVVPHAAPSPGDRRRGGTGRRAAAAGHSGRRPDDGPQLCEPERRQRTWSGHHGRHAVPGERHHRRHGEEDRLGILQQRPRHRECRHLGDGKGSSRAARAGSVRRADGRRTATTR